jgi:ketosteroid isomerase-like protein
MTAPKAAAVSLAFIAWPLVGEVVSRSPTERSYRRGYEAIARGDYEFALLATEPDVELRVWGDARRTLGLAESYRGYQGVRDLLGEMKQDMNDLHWELEQIVDLGDRVAVRVTFIGEGALSGVTTRNRQGIIF